MTLVKLALLLLVLASACEVPQAITIPLPMGRSAVVDLVAPDECTPAHEAVHQRQIAQLGSAAFVARLLWERVSMDEPRCGSIERPAYAASWACFARLYPPHTAAEFAEAQTWRCQ